MVAKKEQEDSLENTEWINLVDFLETIQVSIKNAQIRLLEQEDNVPMALKDFKIEFPAEIQVNVIDNTTKVRLPNQSARLDKKIENTLFSRISFTANILPIFNK